MLSRIIILLVVFNFSSALGNENDNRFILNAVIRQLFELFRNIVLNGSNEKDVPILDPYLIENVTLNTEGPILSSEIHITKAEIVGIGNFQLDQFIFSKDELALEINMTIPFVSIESDDYEFSGIFLEFLPVAGHGKLQFDMQNILILGKVYLKQSDDDISVIVDRIENLRFSIENISSTTEFDGNIDGIINHMIEDLLADYLNRLNAIISELYGPIVVHYLNILLNKFETWKIISVIV